MHTPEDHARECDDLFYEITVENVEDNRANRPRATCMLVIRHPDISEAVSIGPWHISGSLERILQACEENLPEFLFNMEARVPEERCAALPLVGLWRTLFGEGMAVARVVRDSAHQ